MLKKRQFPFHLLLFPELLPVWMSPRSHNLTHSLPSSLRHHFPLPIYIFFLSDILNFLNGTPSLKPMQLFLPHTRVRIPILSFLSCLCSTCNPAFSLLLRSHSYMCSVCSLRLDASFSWVLSTRVRCQHSFSFLGFLPPASAPYNLPCIAQGWIPNTNQSVPLQFLEHRKAES